MLINFVLVKLITCIFFVEGLGLTRQQDIFGLVYCGVVVLFGFLLSKKKMVLPLVFSIFYIIFLIFSLISSLNFSLDKETSFYWWLFFLACFSIFIFFYNHKKTGEKIVNTIVVYLAPVFVFLFLLKKLFPNLFLFSRLALNENNLFFDYNVLHNHLGIVVGLFLIFFIWKFIQEKKTKYIILVFLFFPFLLISYNRSATLTFLIILVPLIFFLFKKKTKTIFLFIFLFVIGLIFLFGISGYKNIITKIHPLETKSTFGLREVYWKQANQSIHEKPIFGIGFGNFGYASYKYEEKYDEWIDNTANIFLEIQTGGGILSLLPFAIAISLILLSFFKKRSIYSFLFIFLLINFQTDFSYRNYSLFVLFVILASIIYQEKHNEKINNVLSGLIFMLGTILLLIGISNIFFLFKKYDLTQKIFPINKKAYPLLIKQKFDEGDYESAKKFDNLIDFIAPLYYERLVTAGRLYESLGEKEKALNYYQKICEINKYCNLSWIKKTAYLINDIYSRETTFDYLKKRIKIFRDTGMPEYLENEIESEIKKICLDLTENKECYFLNIQEYKYFYEPKPGVVIKEENKSYPVKYSINKDTLNERFDYSVKKENGVYRIITLGDSLTFGSLVDTKNNWTEILENKLNNQFKCQKLKRVEVINLGGEGYDVNYIIQKYFDRGVKYNPNLIIWPIRNFYRINELIQREKQIIEKNNKKNLNQDEIWEEAKKQIRERVGDSVFLEKQKNQLNKIPKDFFNKTIFIFPYEMDSEEKNIFPPDFKNIELIIPENDYYPDTGVLSKDGNMSFSETVYKYLTEDFVLQCPK